jgi:hypothetical protein
VLIFQFQFFGLMNLFHFRAFHLIIYPSSATYVGIASYHAWHDAYHVCYIIRPNVNESKHVPLRFNDIRAHT